MENTKAKAYFEAMVADTKEMTRGQSKAIIAYMTALNYKGAEFVAEAMFEEYVHDFVTTLREAGATDFVVIGESTALMGNIHCFIADGCVFDGCVELERNDGWNDKKRGLKFRL